ncbi:CPBP family intramembrane metalloprotease [Natronosporangium hydrolyticum]|uniref:CPBP family intramembrane metalloprotease n=1 Tax=Natronosporangium hydrolyticum TaxID=2811111 RepID=A0A895YAM8_9ACTN|nr:type II CAAX endopeptidase family protein [Natronosporangium hydrolyticum]QSB13302.1 CPBP family intramembrane metalloprotease [Natronosporangium hydrolyticum]
MRPRTAGVPVFLLLAFGLAWGGIFGAQALGLSLANPLVQLPIAFTPAIAAVIVRAFITREGFRDAGLAPRLGPARRYYLLAWLGPVLVLGAAVALGVVTGLYRPDLAALRGSLGTEFPVPAALLLFLGLPLLLVPVFWGEEFGWRSYLQQRISRRPVTATLITAVVWMVWHYPLVFTDYVDYADPLLGIVTWTLLVFPVAIILAWLFLRSGSVWVACLAHAGNNMILGVGAYALFVEDGGLDSSISDLLTLAPMAAIALWILLTGRLTAASTPDLPTGRSAVVGRPGVAGVGDLPDEPFQPGDVVAGLGRDELGLDHEDRREP